MPAATASPAATRSTPSSAPASSSSCSCRCSRAGRWLAYALGVAVVLLTGFDRVALGVHYVSDVVAGWIVALACLAGTAGAFEVWRREHGRPASSPSEGVDPDAADEMSDHPPDSPDATRHPSREPRDAERPESRLP